MPALKDVGGMSSLSGLATLASSSLWHKQVAEIRPAQIHAFVTRLALTGHRDVAETAIDLCIGELCRAVESGEIPAPAMLSYSPPSYLVMTAGELRDGLVFLGLEKGAAILFALEVGIDADSVCQLTWTVARRLREASMLSPLAIACLGACERHKYFQYVFWKLDAELDLPNRLSDLERGVFDAFGLQWPELETVYGRLIMVDNRADAMLVAKVLKQ